MSQSEPPSQDRENFSPAVPLEISGEQVREIDAVLQRFAESAELETALVVHRNGGLVSGISSEADVTVEVISALVASASGALQALLRELGEPGDLESFHLGDGRALYMKAMLAESVLVGVSPARLPVGLVREAARQISTDLESLLQRIPTPEILPTASETKVFASLTPTSPVAPVSESPSTEEGTENLSETPEAPYEEEPNLDESEEPVPEDVEGEDEEATEVIEMLGDDEPEIVIDGIDSPFEAEEQENEKVETVEEGVEEEIIETGPVFTGSIFEIEKDEEDEVDAPSVFEEAKEAAPEDEAVPAIAGSIFEVDEEPEEEEGDGNEEAIASFELDVAKTGEGEGTEEESAAEVEEEGVVEEEEEVRSSGPFYF